MDGYCTWIAAMVVLTTYTNATGDAPAVDNGTWPAWASSTYSCVVPIVVVDIEAPFLVGGSFDDLLLGDPGVHHGFAHHSVVGLGSAPCRSTVVVQLGAWKDDS